jgi:hypothetical protein
MWEGFRKTHLQTFGLRLAAQELYLPPTAFVPQVKQFGLRQLGQPWQVVGCGWWARA